jgi:phage host-nuclease inhibitor protein Gam
MEIKTWAEADNALKDIAIVQGRIDKEEAAYNKTEQERRAKISESHAPLKEAIEKTKGSLLEFAETHREECGGIKKLTHGEIGFRKNPPSLKVLPGKVAAGIIKSLKASKKFADRFIKVKEDLDKPVVMAAYKSGELGAKDLERYGMTVEQGESFICKPYPAIK